MAKTSQQQRFAYLEMRQKLRTEPQYTPDSKIKKNPYVILITSLTKIAPVPKRQVTLPRLEFLSSLLAVYLGEAVWKALHIQHWKISFGHIFQSRCDGYEKSEIEAIPIRNQMETIQNVSKKNSGTIPRCSESSLFCSAGSAGASKLSAVVVRTRMAKRSRKQIARFSRTRLVNPGQHRNIIQRGFCQHDCSHYNINRTDGLEFRSRFNMESTSTEYHLDTSRTKLLVSDS